MRLLNAFKFLNSNNKQLLNSLGGVLVTLLCLSFTPPTLAGGANKRSPQNGEANKRSPQNGEARIFGVARNALTGEAISDVEVTMSGPGGTKNTHTNPTGSYSFPNLGAGTFTLDFNKVGFIPVTGRTVFVSAGQQAEENVSMSPPLSQSSFRITMSWSAPKPGAVQDVDSYLSVPGERIPVHYNQCSIGGAALDRDDVDWIGPETVTIPTLKAGTYQYYVSNFSAQDDPLALALSEIRISIYQGSTLLKAYSVPTGGSGFTYHVFDIVNTSASPTIVDVERYDANLYVDNQGIPGPNTCSR